MKKLLPLLILLTQTVLLSAQISFQKTYGYNGTQIAGPVTKTLDGGFIMAGTSGSHASGGSDVYIVKTDSAGVLQWANTYGTINDEQGAQVSQTADGGYIVTGYYDNDKSGQKLLLMKLTATGSLSWTRSYGVHSSTNYTYNEDGYYVLQTADKGYLISGASLGSAMYIIKTDSMGIQQSSRVFNAIYSSTIQQTSDGNYVLMGMVYYNPTSTYAIYLVKITANDSVLWEKLINFSFDNFTLSSFQQTADKGFIISGTTHITGSSSTTYTPCLIKTDSAAIPQWGKTYSWKNSQGVFAMQTHDGGYAFCANTAYNGNMFLLKTTANGSLQSAASYGDTSLSYYDSYVYNVVQTHDKGFALCGYTTGFGVGGACYLIKTDSLLNSGCYQKPINPITNTVSLYNVTYTVTKTVAGFDSTLNFTQNPNGTENVICYQVSGINKMQQQNDEVTIYPNPAINQIFIDVNTNDKLSVIIYDVNGKQVLNTTIANKSSIDISTLANGVYTLTLSSANFSENKKLVIIK